MMSASNDVPWDTCTQDNCIGARLAAGGDRCWEHTDEQAREVALKRLGKGDLLDARGVTITQELLARLLAAVPHNEHGDAVLDARFDKATFKGDAVFGGTTRDFQSRTTVFHKAQFDGATFSGDAVFDGVTFQDRTSFERADFEGDTVFDRATFQRQVSFEKATFHGRLSIAAPRRAGGDGIFRQATFKGSATIALATFQGKADFDQAVFEAARQVGPLAAIGGLDLDGITCNQRIRLAASAPTISAKRARFAAGAQLWFRWADVWLDDAEFAAPSILTTATGPGSPPDEEEFVDGWRLLWGIKRGPDTVEPAKWAQPRLLSLCRADVANLTIADIDLRTCQFAGVHHLDQLRFDGEPRFATAPGGWRWAQRQTLAEEHTWRHTHGASDRETSTISPDCATR